MIVKCPKCNFSQPKDQYCARCGVDMEKYIRPLPPRWLVWIRNPILQITIILLVTAGILSSLFSQYSFKFNDGLGFFSGGLQISRSQSSPSSLNESDPAQFGEAATANSSSPPGETSDELKNANLAIPAGQPASGAAAAISTESNEAVEFKVLYLEVPMRIAESLYSESQATGQFSKVGGYFAGVLPEVNKKIEGAKSIQILKTQSVKLELGHSHQWFIGLHQSEPDELGITPYLELTDIDNNGIIRGNMEIVRSWKETASDPASQRSSFPAIFELSKGSGFFLSGFLPRRSPMENFEALTSIDAFKVLKSQNFKAQQSEFFVIVIY